MFRQLLVYLILTASLPATALAADAEAGKKLYTTCAACHGPNAAVADPAFIRSEGKITGEFAMALEKVTTAYVEFSIVGDTGHPNAAALFDAGRDVFEPRKLLHYEEPGRYPDRGKPAIVTCVFSLQDQHYSQ